TAAVVLSNTGQMIQDVSRHLVRPDYALARQRTEVTLPADRLDRCVGRYQPRHDVVFDVRRVGDRLTVEVPVTGRLPLRAENAQSFFLPELAFEFVFPGEGPATEMLFRPGRGQMLMPIRRVSP